jgi:hypothetical protein
MCRCTFCHRKAYFGINKAECCGIHKKQGMEDLIHKKCIYQDCNINPSFNYPDLKAKFCYKHKSKGMINTKNSFCIIDGCNITASFNYSNKKKGLYCFAHKENGMINVKNKHCFEKNCLITPSFNYPNNNIPLYCVKHKLEGMIYVRKIYKRMTNEMYYKKITGHFNLGYTDSVNYRNLYYLLCENK